VAPREKRRGLTSVAEPPTRIKSNPIAGGRPVSRPRLITCVLLPFAAGYYLSYLFRTINALIAGDLASELGLSAADLGFLTSVYFLVFAAVQLPLGAWITSVDLHDLLAIRWGGLGHKKILLKLAWRVVRARVLGERIGALSIGDGPNVRKVAIHDNWLYVVGMFNRITTRRMRINSTTINVS
jgi:hypothetical protein